MDRCRKGRQNAQVQSHVAVVVSGNNGMSVRTLLCDRRHQHPVNALQLVYDHKHPGVQSKRVYTLPYDASWSIYNALRALELS